MRINLLTLIAFCAYSSATFAGGHGDGLYHSIQLDTEIGVSHGDALTRWEMDGWVGKDRDKLWLKSEGDVTRDATERAEFWGLYSRAVSEFWDAQIGIRQDIQPQTTTYLALGFDGLAPYYFETELHLFISDRGNVSARLKEKNEINLTQRTVLEPYLELNISAEPVQELGLGAGLTSGEVGLLARYEITKAIAPFIDVRYESKFGGTAKRALSEQEARDGGVVSLGLRVRF